MKDRKKENTLMLKGRPMSIKFIYRSKLKPLSVPSLLSLVTLCDLSRKLCCVFLYQALLQNIFLSLAQNSVDKLTSTTV